MRIWKKLVALSAAVTLSLLSIGCAGDSTSALDAKNPVTVTVWNYYNGDQLNAFDQMVEDFNATVGLEKGIIVVSVSQGNIGTLADELIDSVDGKAGAQELPVLASVYSETAYILDGKDALAPLDNFFTEEELSKYVDAFINEGRFNAENELLLFPISKSSEVFTANKTDWEKFEDASGISLESIQTVEDLTKAAEEYYKWTDELTPDVAEDGKALYGRDSLGNLFYVGCYQLGHEMFQVMDGELTIDLDRETFKTIWDNFYVPYVNGYFGAYANYRSEDAKTGRILAMTTSSSSMSYMPTAVTLADNSTYDIEVYVADALPFENAVNKGVVQQGANYCMLKGTEAEQEGAVEFLKWFTEEDRNVEFSLLSGYSPVLKAANTEEAIREAYAGDISSERGQAVLSALLINVDQFTNQEPYVSKPFPGCKDVRTLIETSFDDICKKDRQAVLEAIAAGASREEAVASYVTDEYFDAWFTQISHQIEELTK